MICVECQVERDDKDFYGKEVCYKCVYLEKTRPKKKKEKQPIICKECDQVVKSPRRLFCCEECARINKNKCNQTYWTNNIKFQAVGFKHDGHTRNKKTLS